MKCKEIKYLLPEFVEHTLPSEEEMIVSRHLESCRNCSSEYNQIADLYAHLGKEPENILQQSYWNNLIPLIHSRIERKSGRLYKGLLTKISIPAAATILAIVVLVRVFTGSRPEALPVYNTQSVLNNIIAELRTSDVTNMSLEELNLLSNLEQKGDNGSDKYVINKILNEQKSVVESDYVNMESALKIMDDDELNKLITYLDQSQN
jgi:hypothetical protein